MNKPLILVVEDDAAVRNLITTTLETNQYNYIEATCGEQAIKEAASNRPDVILLDLGLPDIDGMVVIQTVRNWSKAPITVISARSESLDKIQALDAGADDYLTKPFSVEELLARLRVTFRHLKDLESEEPLAPAVYVNGDLKIDYDAGCVYMAGEELHLTPNEYKLLCVLAKNTGKVLTHTYLTQQIWGSANDQEMSSLRVFMATLRKKIESDPSRPKYIQTHVGIGYRMLRI